MLKTLTARLILSSLAEGGGWAIAATTEPAMMIKTTKGNLVAEAKGITHYS